MSKYVYVGGTRDTHGYSYIYPNGKEHRRCKLCDEIYAATRRAKR